MKKFVLCFCLCIPYIFCSSGNEHRITINLSNNYEPLNHFWESTGFCPPLPHSNASSFMLSSDMKQNLLLIASVPHNGIKQVRIHWLLELVSKKGSFYDYYFLDKFLIFMKSIGLKPGFEIMGNPSNYFNSFDDIDQVVEFKRLITLLAKRYIQMFGLKYVASWNFETWNEPDHEDFDNVTMTVNGFLKYFDACSIALSNASPSLKFGAPGGSCRQPSFSKRCWALFDHVVNGVNYFTGKKGKLDFISIHKKGNGTADNILNEELETISAIHKLYPSLDSVAIYNDEADPLVGWSKPLAWRGDTTYAALIVKVISQHQNQVISNFSNINYALLSNDNGFLSYAPHFFTQRTLNARFQINNTDPNYVSYVKKPAIIVMGLLSKLGDMQVARLSVSNFVGGISSVCRSCSSYQLSTILYNSADTNPTRGKVVIKLKYSNLNLTFSMHSQSSIKSVICTLSDKQSNPYGLWKNMGSPNFPSVDQLSKLYQEGEPSCSDPISFQSETKLELSLPGVVLHHVCWKPTTVPGPPTNLQAFNITTGQILLTWQDVQVGTKCIKSYAVQFADLSKPTEFVTVNKHKIIFNSFVFVSTNTISGYFTVHVIDYWGRFGYQSDIVKYTQTVN